MNDKQLYEDNEEIIFKQNEKFDILINQAKDLKDMNVETNKELKKQDKYIKKLDNGMNEVHGEMKKTDNKLNQIIISQSYCKLYLIIAVELIVMIIFLII